jgi:hypothetical protein
MSEVKKDKESKEDFHEENLSDLSKAKSANLSFFSLKGDFCLCPAIWSVSKLPKEKRISKNYLMIDGGW